MLSLRPWRLCDPVLGFNSCDGGARSEVRSEATSKMGARKARRRTVILTVIDVASLRRPPSHLHSTQASYPSTYPTISVPFQPSRYRLPPSLPPPRLCQGWTLYHPCCRWRRNFRRRLSEERERREGVRERSETDEWKVVS